MDFMKGISTIIAIILLLIIVIALIGSAYLFIFGFLTVRTSKTINLLDAESYWVIIQNVGTDRIASDDIRIFVNGKQTKIINAQSIEPRQSTILKFIPVDFGTILRSAKVDVVSPSNALSYTTDIISHELSVNPSTVAFWHFNEGSGFNFTADSSGNVDTGYYNHGYIGNNQNPSNPDNQDPSWDTGKFGFGLNFDGINDTVSVRDTSSLKISNNITVEAWVKTDSSNTSMAIADRYDSGTFGGGWKFYLIDGNISLELVEREGNVTYPYIGGEAIGFTDLRDGSWHHVLGTYNGSFIAVYVDGKLERLTSYSDTIKIGGPGLPSYGTRIGHYCPICGGVIGANFDGIIDELRIQNKSITQEEILGGIYGS